jgi:phosphate/sulfate permease
METFYLILVIILFILAISDLVVGVSNDAVNFLNSALGSKAASFRTIMIVASLGVLAGATFSSGMMEVARKGIFHPEYFYFSEIIILFLAVMVTDVILLDTFNTFGMPTSTTVSIVFELLGAAVAISAIKIWTDPNALELWQYINSAKALAIISGILLSVVVAFSCGALIQYLSRLLFTFNYESRIKYIGAIWGGLAITAITYFILIKGAKGASFMDADLKTAIKDNSFMIMGVSFVIWTVLLQVLTMLFKFDILKLVVLVGTFALAMAFAGNDLVNFIGVPLAGFNSYEMFIASGATDGSSFLMDGLAGKVPTPTLLLLLAGLIMVITLITSKKARSVVKTSLDLGRQDTGSERFASYYVSRALVRNFSGFATRVNKALPESMKKGVNKSFDDTPFTKKHEHLGAEAPSFDMIRASVTLVVASILIAIGTSLKLPLSTTYVTFMVFMGTSLADGAWGRESAVYRVSGVLSVIGGWFFTAFSAFTAAFILAMIFSYGGILSIIVMIIVAAVVIYRTHALHKKRAAKEEGMISEFEEDMDKERILSLATREIKTVFGRLDETMKNTMEGLDKEDLNGLTKTYSNFAPEYRRTQSLTTKINNAIEQYSSIDLESGHFYVLASDYLGEMARSVYHIIRPSLHHVDNHHKPLLPEQMDELKKLYVQISDRLTRIVHVYENADEAEADKLFSELSTVVRSYRTFRKNQIKRIQARKVGTRNSILFYHLLSEYRNLALFSNRVVKIYDELMLHPEEDNLDDGGTESYE